MCFLKTIYSPSLKAFPCLRKMVEYPLPCIVRVPDDYFALILLNLITYIFNAILDALPALDSKLFDKPIKCI